MGYFKFRFQRVTRRWQRDLHAWRIWLSDYFQLHIWGKWRQLGIIRRLVVVWWGILALLMVGMWQQFGQIQTYFLTAGPAPGGVYVEGVVGEMSNINPILSDSSASTDVSRLVFNGLTRVTPDRQIEGDLASSWTISPDGKTYTFRLREDVKWHDGTPFTARDVVFTLGIIQHPDTRSPLANSWQGVKVAAADEHTVVYTLAGPSTFIHYTTVGILPAHLLEGTDPAVLRVASFNQMPVGTGPFKMKSFAADRRELQLEANQHYFGGKPQLELFNFRYFKSDEELMEAFAKRQVTGVSRLQDRDTKKRESLPAHRLNRMGLPDEVALFYNTDNRSLAKPVRAALTAAIDRQRVVDESIGGFATALQLPLLPGQLGYTTAKLPPAHDPTAAKSALEAAGWNREQKLRLVTLRGGDYTEVAESIARQWADIGVKTELVLTDRDDLQQTYIRPRNYDVLLYGINIGADPDVYAYWHSSQASDPGLNLSLYSNTIADRALESGRITTEPGVRASKYRAFLSAWVDDLPATILYSPEYVYLTAESVRGIGSGKLVQPADRFYEVENWTVNLKRTRRTR